MKCEPLVLLAAWLTFAAADSGDGPLDFLFSRCEEPEEDVGVGGCVRDLLRSALDLARPKFSTGFEVGNKTVVLEPLKMPKPDGSRQGRSSKLKLSNAQLFGLSKLHLDSVMLTDSTAAAKVAFHELAGEMSGMIYFGFLPIRATLKVQLFSPKLMVGTQWDASNGDLQLEKPHAKLWLNGYNITIAGMGAMGKTVAKKLNEDHEEIFEFLKPSLEAAIARRINKLDQEERNAALGWLQNALS